jgi:predicted hydrocarbon binding protein
MNTKPKDSPTTTISISQESEAHNVIVEIDNPMCSMAFGNLDEALSAIKEAGYEIEEYDTMTYGIDGWSAEVEL